MPNLTWYIHFQMIRLIASYYLLYEVLLPILLSKLLVEKSHYSFPYSF